MLEFVGDTSITTKVAAVTLSVVEPDMCPSVALIVVEPGPAAVASPALLIEAAPAFGEKAARQGVSMSRFVITLRITNETAEKIQ